MKRADFDRDKFISETWPEALESGEFKQGQGALYKGPKRKSLTDKQKEAEYCCLGVACELLSRMRLIPRKEWLELGTLPDKVAELLGINNYGQYGKADRDLTLDNDGGKSFPWIAKKIRQVAKSKRAGFVKS